MQKTRQRIILWAAVAVLAAGTAGWTHLAERPAAPGAASMCRQREPDPPPPPPQARGERWFSMRKDPPDPPRPKPKPRPKRDEALA